MNSGVSGAGSAEGAAAGGGFKEVSRLFPGSCHISGWGKNCRGGRHRGGCQEEPWGLHSRVGGCPLGSAVGWGESPGCGNRNLLRCGVGGRVGGDSPSWGLDVLGGQGSPHFPGLGRSGCCSLSVCILPHVSASWGTWDLPPYSCVEPPQSHLRGANGPGAAPAPGDKTPPSVLSERGPGGLSLRITHVGRGTEKPGAFLGSECCPSLRGAYASPRFLR